MPDQGTTCPDLVLSLVARFRDNIERYKSTGYNEAQVRQEFINPLFNALGWDMDNSQGHAEQYKDVVHEDSIQISGTAKAPDYAFRIGGTRKFFVETKKPSINLNVDPKPAYQLRRYAWSAKLPLSVLTDFEEFAVYDTRVRPKPNDSAAKARILYLTFDAYENRWDEIASVFSRDAILKGAFDKYAESKKKRGTTEVDDAFLDTIRGWRESLAKDIHKHNDLAERQLNHAVQAIIDRLIFLRIAEDRGTEDHGRILKLKSANAIYPALVKLFHEADARYNSGLFHFKEEKSRASEPDLLTPALSVSDRVLKAIIDDIYYPSEYDFRVFPPDVLGQVYERFLGDVITISTSGKSVKVEPKPEVRKAGGVYYTPTYIVDYIVHHTVGELVKDKHPHHVAGRTATTYKPAKGAHPIRVLDPACGSGSFLLGAYQFLLTWYRDRYAEDPKRWTAGPSPTLWQAAENDYRLTIAERKRILLDHIFGVDIDRQAVEVTKLSLLLKCLEGESSDSIGSHLFHMKERALPDLAANIKCGNSLIAPDFYDGHHRGTFSDEERLRINAFKWEAEFRPALSEGGFDAIVSNPPYIAMLEMVKSQHKAVKPYWKSVYESASGTFDIYVLFLERAGSLLAAQGRLGFIIPNKVLAAEYARSFRNWLHTNLRLTSVHDLSSAKVWPVAVYPIVLTATKTPTTDTDILEVSRANAETPQTPEPLPSTPRALLGKTPDLIWSFITQAGADILFKALDSCIPLEDTWEVCGSCTVSEGSEYPQLIKEYTSLSDTVGYSRFVVSGTISRHCTKWNSDDVQFAHAKFSMPMIQLADPMPERRRDQSRTPKLILAKLAKKPLAYFDAAGIYCGAYTTYIFPPPDLGFAAASVLNSKLVCFLFRSLYDSLAMGGGYLRFQPPQMRRVPIPIGIATSNLLFPLQQAGTDIAELLDRFPTIKDPDERRILQQQIDATDREIDRLVYELYGLTEEETEIVERATAVPEKD